MANQKPDELTYLGIVQRVEGKRNGPKGCDLSHDTLTIAMCGSNSVLKVHYAPDRMYNEGDLVNVTISYEGNVYRQ